LIKSTLALRGRAGEVIDALGKRKQAPAWNGLAFFPSPVGGGP
jgi:hypothetical protein